MDRKRIEAIFEAYFEKYKKTEGDRTAWSAFWTETTPKGVLELNMTKCPRGTIFKVFVDKRKFDEARGWDGYFATMAELEKQHPGLYDEERIFPDMESVI
ncbi:hypothetical protein [Salidesulfovibrio onnuriiensis]|uniref:hypothetical protein n=1 Tax=Salidesulfovibrio onnuriiensis TaxID=2583823 RepID=UPI0011CBFA60|nr:hypothetical protein [Salidesulfovibrio onnuriiensis]